ncbi:MAG: enoyl-CoA hydratase/isomerase family protein [Deltaproteobacteria bacterium]|nr:enoyl-CoA hydratase/isomerase family protein [Deltaproteobacteria bacterium]
MKKYETIEYTLEDEVASIYLNRPDVRNAFNGQMIIELMELFNALGTHPDVRVITIEGRGKMFCAGVDLNWMRGVNNYEDDYKAGLKIARCMYDIYTCKKPTIAKVHGGAFGGATGLIAACDFVYTVPDTVFSLSEVKIGVVPACISPYVINRVGAMRARELMISGERIGGADAEKYGLANKMIAPENLESFVKEKIALIKTGGPVAIETCKRLVHEVKSMSLDEAQPYTAKLITDLRFSKEGQEGMLSFIEKRKPNWVK